MQYTSGQGYNISRLTLGTVQLGLNYSIQHSKPDATQSLDILNYALHAGINTLDTARTYGDAEKIIGNFCKKYPDRQVNIVSKFKISDKNLNDFGRARDEVYGSITTSLEALQLKRIPICLFHKDKDQPMPLVIEILPRILENLLKDGLIETGGISVHHPDELKYILDHDIIKAIQVPMNVFDQRLKQSGLLQQMHSNEKLIFIRSIFLKGLFFLKPDQLPDPLKEAGVHLLKMQKIADDAKISLAQLAFSYIRDMKEVTSLVFGADNMEQIQQNILLLESDKLDGSTCEAIEREFQKIPEHIITPQLWTI